MDMHTGILYGCSAAVVVPGTQLLRALAVPPSDDGGGRAILRAVRREPAPVVSVAMVSLMAAAAVAQSVFPALVDHLEPAPGAPWWRLLTATLVQSSGGFQTLFNLAALIAVAPVAEWLLGPARRLLVYVASGPAANVVSAVGWSPRGAGDSVAICGLVGAMATLYALTGGIPALRRLVLLIPTAGAVLCLLANNHGVGVLAGCALGAVLVMRPGPGTATSGPRRFERLPS
ncbi:rhomboid family intramembrane serine protease [Wenjunlia tyrosinilytica]|uniref:Peptidase S54 rhomboid domain-containing protein n=1 Tax=Wenjunlia tyrosinilytica TaxID=1544741 RepID=A0A918DYC3_9ACTN|nr:rhomboid family intramembrane serine protease [Wenjunlia tyrosinilytica]GGO90309.1 hypothetical protein GCM10012280_35540 [Wenjunlia tyrosinilytica]